MGREHRSSVVGLTEKAWLAKRRDDVARLVGAPLPRTAANDHVNERATELAAREWGKEHAAELEFQEVKGWSNKFGAVAAGIIKLSELTPLERSAFREWQNLEESGNATYQKQRERKAAALPARLSLDLAGMAVYVDGKIHGSDAGFSAALRQHKLRRVHDRVRANIFMVDDIRAPGKRVSWAATLRGGVIATQDYIASGGAHGPSLVFKAAVNSKRCLWCSEDFVAQHPEIHKLLMACSVGSSWTWARSKMHALQVVDKRARSCNQSEMVLLVTKHEQSTDQDLQPRSYNHVHCITCACKRIYVFSVVYGFPTTSSCNHTIEPNCNSQRRSTASSSNQQPLHGQQTTITETCQ